MSAAFAARRVLAAASHSGPNDARTWKMVSMFLALPSVGVCMANAYMKSQEDSHEQPEFVPYNHLRIRTKKYPWGDGNHTLFHNPHTNPLPGGYESSHH